MAKITDEAVLSPDEPVDSTFAGSEPARKPFYLRLGFQVMAGIILGIALGLLTPHFAVSMKVLGDIFLRLIKTIIAPLVFFNVVLGITSSGNLKSAGKIGLKAVIYFEIVSTIALAITMVIANYSGVGNGMHDAMLATKGSKAASTLIAKAHEPMSFESFLLHMFPDNFIGAFANGALLQVLVISICFGAAVLALKPEQRAAVESGLTRMSDCFSGFINIVMQFAPLGAFGAIAYAIGSNGTSALISLGHLLLVLYASLLFFVLVVLGIICRIYGFNIFRFLRYIKDEIYILFGTASSESAFPRFVEKLQRFGCSKQTVGLVLPTGYAFNLDGTAVYMPLCTMFLANAYGIHLDLHTQIGLLALMMLTSKGAATVSGGTFLVFAATVTASGILPLEGLPLLFGINRFTSQAVAICNAVGNSIATLVVARSSGEFDERAARAEYHRALGRDLDAPL